MELNIIYIRVGTTRSGKMIPYASSVDDIGNILLYFKDSNFSSDDLLDAFALFNYLALRGIRRADNVVIFGRYAETIQGVFDPRELSQAKDRANIGSAFDLRDLGKSLATIEFAGF
jgi:hypothetical protein